jgi:hypothetical protein
VADRPIDVQELLSEIEEILDPRIVELDPLPSVIVVARNDEQGHRRLDDRRECSAGIFELRRRAVVDEISGHHNDGILVSGDEAIDELLGGLKFGV